MNLLEKIESDLKASMKSGDTLKAETLRMVKSDLMYEKAKTGKDLTDEQMLDVVSRAAKKRRESITEFRKGNREDLAEKEEKELAIIELYLPKQLSEEEIEKLVIDKLNTIGEITQKNFGRVMGDMMKELKGKADGNIVRKIITKKMENK